MLCTNHGCEFRFIMYVFPKYTRLGLLVYLRSLIPMALPNVIPVSYTHLDVYKRQDPEPLSQVMGSITLGVFTSYSLANSLAATELALCNHVN